MERCFGVRNLTEDSDPATSVADHEAIWLAEDLGMITCTQGIRLKHALELVAHFSNLDQDAAEQEMMQREEAASLLRTCITSILGKPKFDAAIQFAEFRRALAERTLVETDGSVIAVLGIAIFLSSNDPQCSPEFGKRDEGCINGACVGEYDADCPIDVAATS